ncbi:YqaJ viral recombinase family protein [Comamonadaceae bacterium OTU4NAUVB1]|nr:YqaJ viral recombinase family protein [Comamonadaceae bacterium OTU4NAUVB1]
MDIIEHAQGSAAWLAHRATHFNASDAPAMMGCSPYKTRTQLIHEMHTGLTPEVDAATQRRFDDGHRFEALARPVAEEIVGEDLYPVVGAKGKLSASFDGLTFDEATGFEHKTLNDQLRAALMSDAGADALPLAYRVQMEQQCMVSGATRILFMASKWAGVELVEEMHAWYEPDAELRAAILAGWEQLEKDVAAYVPAEVKVEAVGRTPETLPALRIEVTGAVMASNLLAFKKHALAVFGGINRDLTTDQDFADAEKTVKWCGDVEDRLAAAKQHALSQTESIDALFRAIDEISAEARSTRLELDRLVKSRKDQLRLEIVREGTAALAKHVESLNARLGKVYMPEQFGDFAGAIKGKRTVQSMRDAVASTLAKAKIAASAIADRIQANLALIGEQAAEHAFLFPDEQVIVQKLPEDLERLVKSRIAEHAAAKQRKRDAEALAAAALQTAAAPPPSPAPITASGAVMPLRATPITGAAAAAPAPGAVPTLRLGQLNARIAPLQISAEGLASLGFPAAGRDRAAVLYHEVQFPAIRAALVQHLQGVEAQQAA